MIDQAISNQQLNESEFAKALDCIESPDPETRRAGAARLEKIGGNRSFQVASVLVGDADPIVASIARRICSAQTRSGTLWRNMQKPVRPAEKQFISNGWQLLDEIVFICRRNLSELSYISFISAIPKLLLVFILFAGPYLFSDFHEYANPPVLIALLFFHQLFWRPLAWLAIGKAFIGGFPDRMSRQQARAIRIQQRYIPMVLANLPPALAFSALFGYGLNLFTSFFNSLELFWPLFLCWLLIWEPFVLANPMVLLRGSLRSAVDGIFLRFSSKHKILKRNLFFIAILTVFYSMFYSSSIAFSSFLGMSLQTTGLKIRQEIWYLALLISADCLLDPFVIGYRIMLARLNLGAEE